MLAQVDSSVGGKTGIDTRHGKNLVGAFHQPLLVIADTDLLDSLSPREFRSGYAEVAKYGLINDEPFFAWLEKNWKNVFAGGPDRVHAVATSCRAKAAIVGRDEREAGERALLNLGHTFAHALEAAAGYSERLLHGEAVAIGIVLAFRLSSRLGLCRGEDAATRHGAFLGRGPADQARRDQGRAARHRCAARADGEGQEGSRAARSCSFWCAASARRKSRKALIFRRFARPSTRRAQYLDIRS